MNETECLDKLIAYCGKSLATCTTEVRHLAELDRYPGTPRWVKVFGIFALVLVLLFVILHLTGRGLGDHRPGEHPPSGGGPTWPQRGH